MSEERISIIGLGNAGCGVVDCVAGIVNDSVAVVAVDSDKKALSRSAAPLKLQLGATSCRGLGTGGDAKLGRACAEDDLPAVRELVSHADLVILVCGLGGGSAGAAPLILDIARDEDALTLCFGILPASFEGSSCARRADELMAALRASADAIIAVPNDRMIEHAAQQQLNESFKRINELIASGLRGVWQLLTRPGFIDLGFADIRRATQGSAGCTFSVGEGRGKSRAEDAVKRLLSCPTLDGGKALKEAKCVLVSIAGGTGLTLSEVGDIMSAVSSSVGQETEVVMGTVVNREWRTRIAITAVVSGPGEPPQQEVQPDREHKPSGGTGKPRRSRMRRKDLQSKLRLDTTGKGRFKDIEPTFMDGEDLDIPTFIRRDIRIEK